MYKIEQSDSKIDAVLNKAAEGQDGGSAYPGMSYEDGIVNALNWLFGSFDDPPFDD